MSFFFARSLLVRVTIFCASSMVSTESLRPPNHPIPVQRDDAVASSFERRSKVKIDQQTGLTRDLLSLQPYSRLAAIVVTLQIGTKREA